MKSTNQVAGEVVLVELVKVKVHEVVVSDLQQEHVIDRGQDLLGYDQGRALPA